MRIEQKNSQNFHPNQKHFAAYIITFLVLGAAQLSLGPLIPFLAEQAHLNQTQYSFLFACRAAGMLGGALLLRLLQASPHKPPLHNLLAYSHLVIFITCILFVNSGTLFLQGLSMFFCAIALFLLEIAISICIILISDKDSVESRMMIIFGVFGVGGFLSPLLVRMMKKQSFYLLAGISIVMVPMYWRLPSPEKNKNQEHQEERQVKRINHRGERLLSCTIFIFLGSIIAQGGWSASYAVLKGLSTSSQATIFPTFFFLSLTVSRFIIIFIKIKGSEKLRLSILGVLLSEIFSVIIMFLGFQRVALLFNSISLGVCMSSIYPLIFSVSCEFGMPLSEQQASSLAIWGAIGQGLLSPLCAILMQIININMFFYYILVLFSILWVTRNELMKYFQCEQTRNAETLIMRQITNIVE